MVGYDRIPPPAMGWEKGAKSGASVLTGGQIPKAELLTGPSTAAGQAGLEVVIP